MFFSFAVYAFCLFLVFWGMNFSGKKQFHQDVMSFDAAMCLRGFAAFCVLLHHISQADAFKQAKELSVFPDIGYFFVAIFFFCSGYGLIKNLNSKENYLNGFLKKRAGTLIVPFYVMTVFYAVFKLVTKAQMPLAQWICSILGLVLINDQAWFVIVLLLLYVAFYFTYKNIKNKNVCLFVMLAFILLLSALGIFMGHFAWWTGDKNWWLSGEGWGKSKWWMRIGILWFEGEWWFNSSFAFFLGLLIASYENSFIDYLKNKYWLKNISLLIITFIFLALGFFCLLTFGYWSEWYRGRITPDDKLITYIAQTLQITCFILMIYVVMMKFHTINPVLKFFGKISLHTYLMELMSLTVFKFLIVKNGEPVVQPYHWNIILYCIAVLALTIVLALITNFISKKIVKLCKI